ncbi:hypothetical protein EVAR_69001_1 [Eumeta japonica]|uniref:Uncharacterized protein n=1 Tax=Eumeta variegata TaxID=151549 RepID=A0A4C2A8C0_EUMVA|nr:hypothetical protein EVAR_69001_1 [Eumeta japonica]
MISFPKCIETCDKPSYLDRKHKMARNGRWMRFRRCSDVRSGTINLVLFCSPASFVNSGDRGAVFAPPRRWGLECPLCTHRRTSALGHLAFNKA